MPEPGYGGADLRCRNGGDGANGCRTHPLLVIDVPAKENPHPLATAHPAAKHPLQIADQQALAVPTDQTSAIQLAAMAALPITVIGLDAELRLP